MLALSFFLTETFATALVRTFTGHGTLLILWAWSMFIDNQHVYGLLLAMNVTHFIAFSEKVEYSRSGCIFACISATKTSNLQKQQSKGCSWQ